jgi:hypothetical protein
LSDRRKAAVSTWGFHVGALEALRRTLDALGPQIPVLVVKGAVLAYSLHRDVVDRPMSDVDLRIRPRDFFAAIRALEARGFEACWGSRQLGAVGFVVQRTLVEIETSIGPPGSCAISVARMMERSVARVLPGDLHVREPEVHDHAVLLVINAFKDKIALCPPWAIRDLELIARVLDVDVFLARVAEARLGTMTWIVAAWLASRDGNETWAALRDALAPRVPRPIYARVMRHLLARDPSAPALRVLTRLGCDSRTRRTWALAAAALGTAIATALAARSARSQ